MKKLVFIMFFSLLGTKGFTQFAFPSTDSLHRYTNRFITNSAINAFTDYRMNTLIHGIINWIDSARLGTGGSVGVDTVYALNDSTIRYRKNAVNYTFNIRGRYWKLQQVLTNGSTLTTNHTITLADSLTFASGKILVENLRLTNLAEQTDTSLYKPTATDALGNVVKFPHWPGSGGSGTDTAKEFLQRHYGTIYNDNSWTTVTDNLTNNGVTASVVSNKINVSGGAGTYTQTLDVPGGTMQERWKITGKFQATEKSGSSFGFGVGTRSYNTFGTLNAAARFDATSASNGIVSLNLSGADKIVTSAVGFSVNDYILLTVERNVDSFIVTAKNLNTNAIVTGLYRCDPASSPALHNSGRFAVFSYGGTFTLDSLSVTSTELTRAPLVIIGDSKAQLAGTGVDFNNRFGAMLGNIFSNTIISAGSSDRSVEWVLRTDEIIALKPRAVIISSPSNDPRSGVSSSTTNANLDTLYNRFTAAGIEVYFLLPFPENTSGSGVSQTNIRSHLVATYTARLIDVETPLLQCSNCLSADDVHPNSTAQPIITKAIIESFQLNDASQIQPDVALKSKENTFTERQYITGDFSAKPALELNSFVMQPFAVNNVFMGDNFRYNNSAFIRKYTGYSSVWYQQNGSHIFGTAGTDVAGTSLTHTTRLKIHNNGNISTGDSDPGFKLGITGNMNLTPNSAITDGIQIQNTGGGAAAIGFGGLVNAGAANPIIYSDNNYLALNSKGAAALYLNFDNGNSASFVDFYNGKARFLQNGNLLIGTITDGSERLQVTGSMALDLGGDATLDMYYRGSSGNLTSLPTGTALQQLRVNSGGTGYEWFTPTLSGSTTHDFGTIANNSSATTNITVTGADDGDFVLVTKPAASGWSNGEEYFAWVSASNTVTVRQSNHSGGSAGFGSQTINVKVIKQ